MKRMSEVLSGKSASLAVRRRERSDQIADYAVADVSLFWLLHTVNTAWPALARLCAAPDQHPERLYGVLAGLAGSLLTFSTIETLQSIPPYDHGAPERVFGELETLIRALLETVIPSRVVPIALERVKLTLWAGKINDERLVDGADFYLSVQSALPAHELLEQLPRLCKAGAPDEVGQIVNSALPGIPLRAMSRLPAAIPVRIENQYFALDSAHPAFKRMIAARGCQFYVPSSIPDASLELYAVLQHDLTLNPSHPTSTACVSRHRRNRLCTRRSSRAARIRLVPQDLRSAGGRTAARTDIGGPSAGCRKGRALRAMRPTR
jgi:type VI secretion system protein ImpJ